MAWLSLELTLRFVVQWVSSLHVVLVQAGVHSFYYKSIFSWLLTKRVSRIVISGLAGNICHPSSILTWQF